LEEAMARDQIMAAGGIVLRREQPPLVAVVRLRKRDEWVLPKGKLDAGETPRDAAKREVLEETGHNVTVHEFLGTLVLDTGTRTKVVHYWRMEASGEATRPLMDDVRAVDWLPLDDAVARLSRSHEKTFLENVGPYALAGLIRRTKAKPAAEEKAVPARPAATDKFAPAPAIRAAAARAAAASRPVAIEPVAKEMLKETVQETLKEMVTAKPAAKEVVASKPATARRRRSRLPEPEETVVVPETASVEVALPVEALPVEPAPAVAEVINPTPDVVSEAIETAEASEEHGPAEEAPADAAAALSAEPVVDVAAPVEAEAAPTGTIEAETPEASSEITPAKSNDVERVHAVAAQIKSLTTEAASRLTQAKEQDEAPQDVAAERDGATEPGAAEPATAKAQDMIAAESKAELQAAELQEAELQEPPEHVADPAEPQRRSLAQKVRGWFGRAA
jgi:8-oxo-dGTP diphosphatase